MCTDVCSKEPHFALATFRRTEFQIALELHSHQINGSRQIPGSANRQAVIKEKMYAFHVWEGKQKKKKMAEVTANEAVKAVFATLLLTRTEFRCCRLPIPQSGHVLSAHPATSNKLLSSSTCTPFYLEVLHDNIGTTKETLASFPLGSLHHPHPPLLQ